MQTPVSPKYLTDEAISAVVGHYLFVCIQGITNGLTTDNTLINWQHDDKPVRDLTNITESDSVPRCPKILQSIMDYSHDQLVFTHLVVYRSNPCFAVPDSFMFVLWIREVEFSDAGMYNLNMATRFNFTQNKELEINTSKYYHFVYYNNYYLNFFFRLCTNRSSAKHSIIC